MNYETLAVEAHATQSWALHVTLNRPHVKNAMSLHMVRELIHVFENVDSNIRAVVLRGAGGSFCAGADIKDMMAARTQKTTPPEQAVRELNRAFGTLLMTVDHAPCAVIAVLEGAVMGGGFGLACVSDVAIAHSQTKFGLPETSLGILPAQIAPFVAARIGLTQTRRLAVCGGKFQGDEALRIGLVHFVCENTERLDQKLSEVLKNIAACAPNANRVTKALVHRAAREGVTAELLDDAAALFTTAALSAEGMEGGMAFLQKRPATWAT